MKCLWRSVRYHRQGALHGGAPWCILDSRSKDKQWIHDIYKVVALASAFTLTDWPITVPRRRASNNQWLTRPVGHFLNFNCQGRECFPLSLSDRRAGKERERERGKYQKSKDPFLKKYNNAGTWWTGYWCHTGCVSRGELWQPTWTCWTCSSSLGRHWRSPSWPLLHLCCSGRPRSWRCTTGKIPNCKHWLELHVLLT